MALVVAWPREAQADGFRCGSKLVVSGDSVSRLLKVCGKPALQFKAKESLGGRSSKKQSVTNWIYERGRKRNMVVSIRNGQVVKIRRD